MDDKKRSTIANLTEGENQMEYDEDFTTMTVFCFLKKNVDKYQIVPEKRAKLFWSCLVVQFNVCAMLFAIYYGIATNEGNRFTVKLANNFGVFFIKYPCVFALHLKLYPEIAKGMNIMKLAN